MSGQWTGGKGSARRPMAVDKEIYESNWDKIFSKKDYNVTEDLTQLDDKLNEVIDNHPIRGSKEK